MLVDGLTKQVQCKRRRGSPNIKWEKIGTVAENRCEWQKQVSIPRSFTYNGRRTLRLSK